LRAFVLYVQGILLPAFGQAFREFQLPQGIAMPVVTIPFDFEDLPDKSSIVPICINDTDRHGTRIGWRWITAVVPIADLLRKLARRRLDDVWRVSVRIPEDVNIRSDDVNNDSGRM
jgi:hypothetical protein